MPLIFHRKQNGKTGKKWTCRVGKRWVTLKSLDAGEARAEALKLRAEAVAEEVEAAAGEVEAAAAAVNHQDEARAAPSVTAHSRVSGFDSPAVHQEAPPPPGSPAAEVIDALKAGKTVVLDLREPHQADAGDAGKTNGAGAAHGFADDVNAAAAGGASGDEDEAFDPDELDSFVDDLVEQGGHLAVEVQIRIQAWAWGRYAKIGCAPVPPDHAARKKGALYFGKALRRLLPKHIPIPDWAAGMAWTFIQTTKVQLGPGVHKAGERPPAAAGDAPTDGPPIQDATYSGAQ